MKYNIRFAAQKDSRAIMQFIDHCWRKGHILSRDEKLFHWQYDGVEDRLNIVIALDDNEDIQGMLGYIPYFQSDEKDLVLALWKANSNTGFLGLELLRFLIANEPHRSVMCTGINLETTGKIYSFLGINVRQMQQWYRLRNSSEYRIADIKDADIPLCPADNGTEFKIIGDDKGLREWEDQYGKFVETNMPYKGFEYLKHRYFEHPMYSYEIYSTSKGDTSLILVFRIQEQNDSKALRVIDCIGDLRLLQNATNLVDVLMEEKNCEYADFFESGLYDGLLDSAGWKRVGSNENIIPDYFFPFEQKNITIYCSASEDRIVLFKGDGDQDRPN